VAISAAPYLARVTLTVADRDDALWWRGHPASPRRVAVLIGCGLALGCAAGAAAGWTAVLPAFVVLGVLAGPLIVVDAEHHRLPNRLLAPLAAAAAAGLTGAAAVGEQWSRLGRAGEAGLVALAVLYLVAFLGPLGAGDAKLGAILALYLGWISWPAVLAGMVAAWLVGAIYGGAMLLTRRARLRSMVAFGPALIIGALLVGVIVGHA
jgi:leader peptidase (prepilin peptidase)/N-methyltransferase